MDFEIFKGHLIDAGLAEQNEITGCVESEIKRIEEIAGCKLPLEYEKFLENLGKSGGKFLQGTDVFFDSILEIQEWAVELLEEEGKKNILPRNAFIIFMHQGYEFGYFLLGESEDPEVFFYSEGMSYPEARWKSVSYFLESVLADEIQVLQG
ncbi:MAG: SMI1/KNR4 family protein [Candidatus Thiodiazotropha endolucinida]